MKAAIHVIKEIYAVLFVMFMVIVVPAAFLGWLAS